MSTRATLDAAYDTLDRTAQFTALRCLLIAVVREHPQKAVVLDRFQELMTHVTESMRDRTHPGVAQLDEVFDQIAEGSPEVAAQRADGPAHFVEKLQEHAQHLLLSCQ